MTAVKRKRLRIHLLVEVPSGPVVSTPALGSLSIGGRGGAATRWACVCDPGITMGELDRGTDAPWGVRCDDCEKKARGLGLWRGKPGTRPDAEQLEATGGGCCG